MRMVEVGRRVLMSSEYKLTPARLINCRVKTDFI